MQAGVFCFFHLWRQHFEFQPAHVAMEGSSNVVRNTHARLHEFKSHFQQDFLAYRTWPVSVHLVMTCVGWSFDIFSIFLLSLKQQQNLMKIMFSCIHFPVWPYPPEIMKKLYFIPANYMGWQVWQTQWLKNNTVFCLQALHGCSISITETYLFVLKLSCSWNSHVCSLSTSGEQHQQNIKKWLDHDAKYTSAIHVNPVHDITYSVENKTKAQQKQIKSVYSGKHKQTFVYMSPYTLLISPDL